MPPKSTVAVRIRGREFRIRSGDDEELLQRVAGYLDEAMAAVEKRTGTVDSLEVALLTALNLAREIVRLREERVAGPPPLDPARLRVLIDLAESAAVAGRSAPS